MEPENLAKSFLLLHHRRRLNMPSLQKLQSLPSIANLRTHLHAPLRCLRLLLAHHRRARCPDPSYPLLHDIALASVWVIFARATGVLKWGELLGAIDFEAGELVERQKWEDVEDKLLEFNAIGLFRFDGFAFFLIRVDVGNLFAGDMVGQFVHPFLDAVEEAEGVVVIDNVSGAEFQEVVVLGVAGLSHGGVDFGILDDVWAAVLLQDQANRFFSIAFTDNFSGDVNRFSGGKANEGGVGNFDETVVNAVGVDMLDTSFPHIGAGV